MKRRPYKQTAAGKYKQLRDERSILALNVQPIPTTEPLVTAVAIADEASPEPPSPPISPQNLSSIEQLKTEWKLANLDSKLLDTILGISQLVRSDAGRTWIQQIWKKTTPLLQKIPLKGVINVMAKDKNMNDLLKNLTGQVDTSELLQNMMNDPAMQQKAMDMMKEVMSDEKKLAEMTDMLSKALKKDN